MLILADRLGLSSQVHEREHLQDTVEHTTLRESTTMLSICGHVALSATSRGSWITYGLSPSSCTRSTTPVWSLSVSTNNIFRFPNGVIFASVESADCWPI